MNDRLYWKAYHWGQTLKWRTLKTLRPWIFGRFACLGRDVLARVRLTLPVINIQKGRADFLCSLADQPEKRPRTGQVAPFMERRDILPLIAQQESLEWGEGCPPRVLFMDSFAELTDQFFVHRRNDWGFCAHYSDLRHGERFDTLFESRGLLEEGKFLDVYRDFFSLARSRFGRMPIFFLHFPTALDLRDKFHRRFERILSAVEALAGDFAPFHSLTVDPAIVDWPSTVASVGENPFPYHFNDRTYDAFAAQLTATGHFRLR